MPAETAHTARRRTQVLPVPTEHEEQAALFKQAWLYRQTYPELELMFAIPNGSYKGKASAGIFRAEGLKSGVPDILLPVARGPYHGLFIELKRQSGGTVSAEQKQWLASLKEQGYLALVCKGCDEAWNTLVGYLAMEGGTA